MAEISSTGILSMEMPPVTGQDMAILGGGRQFRKASSHGEPILGEPVRGDPPYGHRGAMEMWSTGIPSLKIPDP